MEQFCLSERQKRSVDDDETLFTAIAWINPSEKAMYDKYPMVLNIDASSQCHREQRPLVSVTCRNTDGNFFPILRCLLANEQQWSFHWMFTNGFSHLLGEDCKHNTTLVIADGDSQEITQLRSAINEAIAATHYSTRTTTHDSTRTQLRRCSVHVVIKSLHKYGPSIQKACGNTRSGQKYTSFKSIIKTVQDWCFSFVEPHRYETYYECQLSMKLLMIYINSHDVKSVLGDDVQVLENCLRCYIFPYIAAMAYYQYMSIRHFACHCNNGVEGEHNMYKHSGISSSTRDFLCSMVDKLNSK